VTGGTAADAYAFTRYAQDRYPIEGRRYIWFVDAGIASNGINPTLAAIPQARKYLPGGGVFGLSDAKTYLSTQATWASLRVFWECVLTDSECHQQIIYNRDGSISAATMSFLPEYGQNASVQAAHDVAAIRSHPPTAVHLNPKRYVYFTKALEFMNKHGSVPVIVLNPVYPTILAELNRYGNPDLKGSLAYLEKLRHRFNFVVVNCTNIYTWGGTATDFMNDSHVNQTNMRRMLHYIVRHSNGALS
jgi:hypothetical protein